MFALLRSLASAIDNKTFFVLCMVLLKIYVAKNIHVIGNKIFFLKIP